VKVVVVLGGGGAKSVAHAGAWKAIHEAGGEVTQIVGTSMGAVIGAALANGRTPADVLQAAGALTAKNVAALDFWSLAKGIFATSILKPDGLKRTIARLVPATSFAALGIPLAVTATDVDSGELVVFGPWHPAPLHDVLYASCALPVYFPPAVIDGQRLADGGLRAVLPLKVAAGVAADMVVAVHVGPGFDEVVAPGNHSPAPPLVRAHDDALRIMMAAQTEVAIAAWPASAPRLVVVRAVAEREATFAVGQRERYFEAGYEATRQALTGTPGLRLL
jgi:NTE family protein